MQSQGSEDAKAPPKVTKCNHTSKRTCHQYVEVPHAGSGEIHDSYSNQATTSWKYPIRFRGKRQGVQTQPLKFPDIKHSAALMAPRSLIRSTVQTSSTQQPRFLPDP